MVNPKGAKPQNKFILLDLYYLWYVLLQSDKYKQTLKQLKAEKPSKLLKKKNRKNKRSKVAKGGKGAETIHSYSNYTFKNNKYI